jgi:hypothetical protein
MAPRKTKKKSGSAKRKSNGSEGSPAKKQQVTVSGIEDLGEHQRATVEEQLRQQMVVLENLKSQLRGGSVRGKESGEEGGDDTSKENESGGEEDEDDEEEEREVDESEVGGRDDCDSDGEDDGGTGAGKRDETNGGDVVNRAVVNYVLPNQLVKVLKDVLKKKIFSRIKFADQLDLRQQAEVVGVQDLKIKVEKVQAFVPSIAQKMRNETSIIRCGILRSVRTKMDGE